MAKIHQTPHCTSEACSKGKKTGYVGCGRKAVKEGRGTTNKQFRESVNDAHDAHDVVDELLAVIAHFSLVSWRKGSSKKLRDEQKTRGG